MSDVVKIKLELSIGFCTATRKDVVKVDREEWDEWDEDYREKFINEISQQLVDDYAEVSVNIEE